MPLSTTERYLLVEKTMSRVATLDVGDFRAVYGVLGFIERQLGIPNKHNVNIDAYIGPISMKEIAAAGITREDLEIIDKKRPANRDLIKKITLKLLEKSRDIKKAERIFMQALENGKSEILSPEDVAEINRAQILNVDTGWFFFVDNTNPLSAILEWTTFTPPQAFDFLDTLSHTQKKSFYSDALKYRRQIINDVNELVQENIHPDEILADYRRHAKGEAFLYQHTPNLYDGNLTPKLLPSFLTENTVHDVQYTYVRHWLNAYSSEYIATVLTQPIAKAKSLIEKFSHWTLAQLTEYEIPDEPDVIEALAPSVPRVKPSTRFMDNLVDIYLQKNGHTPSLQHLDVNTIDNSYFLYLYNESPQLRAELNNVVLTSKNVSSIFTDAVRTEFHAQAKAEIVKLVLYENFQDFGVEIYSLPVAQGLLLTQAFGQWVQCYIKDNCTAQIMTALWPEKIVEEQLPALVSNITATVEPLVTTLQTELVRPAESSSYQPYIAGFLGLVGVTGLAYVAARRFFKPATAKTQGYTPLDATHEAEHHASKVI
jgi:hypothetical protein